jgi:hypothetical protein
LLRIAFANRQEPKGEAAMYPDPEFFKTRLWEQEQDVVHGHLSVPKGMGPQTQKEVLDLGIDLRGPREAGLLSIVLQCLINSPAARIRDAIRRSTIGLGANARQLSDLSKPLSASSNPR